MKYLSSITIVIMTLFQSCSVIPEESASKTHNVNHYNICLILDGTDRLSEENGVPVVTSEEINKLANTLSDKGVGNLYVSYVDKNCDNNHVAIFEWLEERPETTGEKPGYMKMEVYKKQEKAYRENMEAYNKRKEDALGLFSTESNAIVTSAYSDLVAKQKNGSDVNGAINKAYRLLRASEQESVHSHIILISDGCDNVGNKLTESFHNTELVIVNSNVSKHKYGELVSKEFVTLKQAVNYIFK